MFPDTPAKLNRVKAYLTEGYSIRHICLNQMKGEISEPTALKYLRPFCQELFLERQKESDAKVVEAYGKLGKIRPVALLFKMADTSVKEALKREGVKQMDCLTGNQHARKSTVNEGYFEIIDSLEKAYYLGLLYADGTVHMRTKPCRNIVKISLREDDAYILDTLNERINYGRPMYRGTYRDGKGKPFITFNVNSKKACLDLIQIGCVPRKSSILAWPTKEMVPDHLLAAFLRGVFDGDGSMHFSKAKNLCVSLTTSHDFGTAFVAFYKTRFGGECYIHKQPNYCEVHLNTPSARIEFCRFLYKDKDMTICLRRKLDVINRHLEYKRLKQSTGYEPISL